MLRRTQLKRTGFKTKPSEPKARKAMKAYRPKPLPADVKAYHARVRAIGCLISGRENPTLHHVHGGSVSRITSPGQGQRSNHFLVIPLEAKYHCLPGGIDGGMGVLSWEREYGTQLGMLLRVEQILGVDVFALAGIARPVIP